MYDPDPNSHSSFSTLGTRLLFSPDPELIGALIPVAKTRTQLNRRLAEGQKLPWPPFGKQWYAGCTTLIIGNSLKAGIRAYTLLEAPWITDCGLSQMSFTDGGVHGIQDSSPLTLSRQPLSMRMARSPVPELSLLASVLASPSRFWPLLHSRVLRPN